jgi:cytohesin
MNKAAAAISDEARQEAQRHLWHAAKRGDCAGIEAALAAGAQVNCVDTAGSDSTALAHAVESIHVDAVALLLNRGALPNRDGAEHPTMSRVLCGAFKRWADSAAIYRLLLAAGADVEATHEEGQLNMRALHWAAEAHWLTGVQLLLAAGASPNTRGIDGWTALHCLASSSPAYATDAWQRC